MCDTRAFPIVDNDPNDPVIRLNWSNFWPICCSLSLKGEDMDRICDLLSEEKQKDCSCTVENCLRIEI